jgi:RNA polymerase sigma factor (sigma-70 family)
MTSANSVRTFQTTSWTVVGEARRDGSLGRHAFEELCQRYWYPLYAFLRRKGRRPHDAEDLLQGFFAWILEERTVDRADPLRGRFRNFLMGSLCRFEAREFQYQAAAKRSPGKPIVSLNTEAAETMYSSQHCDNETPEMLFEQAWAASLLQQAMQRLRDEMQVASKEKQFECLRGLMLPGHEGMTTSLAAEKLEMSEGAVRVALHRMKRAYAEHLRSLVASTVENDDEIEAEMQELSVILQNSNPQIL